MSRRRPPLRLRAATVLSPQGHSGSVSCLDFSSNGQFLASCAEDRTVRLWSTRDFAAREHRCLRANVGLEHAELVRFSPDSRYGPVSPRLIRPGPGSARCG